MEQVRIDLVPSGVTPNAHASQFDVGRVIRFLLYNGGTAYTLAGTETIKVDVTAPDGTETAVSVTNTSSNYVDFVTTDGLLPLAGLYPCEISITQGSDVIGSKNFNLRVEKDAYNGANIRSVTVGPADICSFTTTLAEPLQYVKCSIVATGGYDGTPHAINGYTGMNIQNAPEAFVPLWTIDNTFRGTVIFNQFVKNGNFASTANWETDSVSISVNNGILSITNNGVNGGNCKQRNISFVSGHKYFVGSDISSSDLTECTTMIYDGANSIYLTNSGITASLKRFENIISINNTATNGQIQLFRATNATTIGTVNYTNVNLIDLTEMFGSTIADYIYTLEQNTTGEGVAFFKTMYPDSYYNYDIGTAELVGTNMATVSWQDEAGTVYGGIAWKDVNGKWWILVTYHAVTMDGSQSIQTSSNNRFYVNIPEAYKVDASNQTTYQGVTSEILAPTTWAGLANTNLTCGPVYGNGIAFRDDTKTSASDWTTYFTNNPTKFRYELTTPLGPYELSTVQVRALVGQNNVFTDTGEVELTYLEEG